MSESQNFKPSKDPFTLMYNRIANKADKYVSTEFKNFVNKLVPQKYSINLLRKPFLTGYFLRFTEESIGTNPIKPNEVILQMLEEKIGKQQKIEKIAHYLDDHDSIGLKKEKVKFLTHLPFDEVLRRLELYLEDYINSVIGEVPENKKENFYELCYRNASYGYLFKLAEGVMSMGKKPL